MNDLRWHPQPGVLKNHEMPVHDGWRELGNGRRWRIAFDLERHERRVFTPRQTLQFNAATDHP